MEEFLPSEIARAVYGYLLSEGCEDAANRFLETSSSLAECKQRIKHGKRLTHANTLLLGKNLVEVLNIACSVHSIVKQIQDKQQKGLSKDGHESLAELLDLLRTCVFSDSRVEEKGSSQISSQPDPPCLRTPPSMVPSLAENYRSLVQECSEGLDLSLSPIKNSCKSKNVTSPSIQPVNRPTSAPGALAPSQLDMDNESAIAAITGIGITPLASYQAVVVSSAPITNTTSCSGSSVIASSSVMMTVPATKVTTSQCNSAELLPMTLQNNLISALPDPPIIVLDSQDQSLAGNDISGTYFNATPCAASTPHPRPAFAPEDTAFILYPPLITDPKPKKVPFKEKNILRRSGRLRKLLPKPHRKDPPNIIHVKVLPQTIDEENEDDADEANEEVADEANEFELAKELSNSEEKKLPEQDNERNEILVDEIEKEINVDKVVTSSDKENVSDENVQGGKSAEKLSDNITTECNNERSTPKPPCLRKNISRSTPRRNSHVRALSFNTPLKPTISRKSNTSPKMPRIKFSPRSAKLSCVKRSSLFSPKNDKQMSHVTEEEDSGQNDEEVLEEEIDKGGSETVLKDSTSYSFPIATRSPAPKLSSAWQEVNDIKITEKPVWDEKIRSFALGDFEDPAPPPKKGPLEKKTIVNKSLVDENSLKELSDQSARNNIRKSCSKNNSRLKKASYTPVKSPTVKETSLESKNQEKSQVNIRDTKQTTRNKKVNSKKKIPQKKTQNKKTNSCSKKESDHCIIEEEKDDKCEIQQKVESLQVDAENKNENIIEVPNNVVHQEEASNGNILLEDLVLSSNSCFPLSNDEVRAENDNLQQSSPLLWDQNKNEPQSTNKISITDCNTLGTKSSSPLFVQPSMLILETPSKDLQSFDPKLLADTTPLIKSIRQEISVLEEDLLLTPSLPPTPQINNTCQRNLIITPCKTADDSPNKTKNEGSPMNQNQNKNSEPNPLKEKENLKNDREQENLHVICSNDNIEDNEDQNCFSTTQTNTMKENNSTNEVTNNEITKNKKRKPLDSTTDTSDDDSLSPHSSILISRPDKSLSKSKTDFSDKSKKKVTKNYIYSTTESSDEEAIETKNETSVSPVKTRLSKLASTLLENERKSLNLKSKKGKANPKSKISKNKVQQSPESDSLANTQNKKNADKSVRKKDLKNRVTEMKSTKKKLESKETTVKKLTPENVCQQLQSDLLKCERKIIFGDGFPSTSDSESDMECFEKKKSFEKTKLKKTPPKSQTLDPIVLSEDSSLDNSNKICVGTSKSVKFNTIPRSSLKSPNKKPNPLLMNNSKTSALKVSEQKILMSNVSEGKTRTEETTVSLGQSSVIIESNSSILESNSKPSQVNSSRFLNGSAFENQNMCEQGFNGPVTGENYQSKKNSGEISEQNGSAAGRLDFSNISPDVESKDRQIAIEVSNSNNETGCTENNSVATNSIGNSNSIGDLTISRSKSDNSKISDGHAVNYQNEEDIVEKCPTEDVSDLKASNNNNTNYQIEKGENVDRYPTQDVNRGDNEICIMSMKTTKNMNNCATSQLNLDHKDIFQVDDGNVVLSFSKLLVHYCSPNLEESVQNENAGLIHLSNQKIGVNDKKNHSQGQATKRRIKLIPIEDEKYKQKLHVDYDFIEHNILRINPRNRRSSNDLDILDCSTSSILSVDNTTVKNQNLNIVCKPILSQERKEVIISKSKKDLLRDDDKKNQEKEDLNKVDNDRKSFDENETHSDHSVHTQETKPSGDGEKHKKLSDKRNNYDNSTESRIRTSRSHHIPHHGEKYDLYERRRDRSRHRKDISPSPRRRRDRDEDNRYVRSYDRRDHRRRHSDRWRRESDRRDFSERRNYTSRSCRKGSSPDNMSSRHDHKRHSKSCHTDEDVDNVEKLKESLSKIEQQDLDRVDRFDKVTTEEVSYQKKVDPRAANVLTYSDIERNESSRDADSLMDFAVISKTKNNRVSPKNTEKSSPDKSLTAKQDTSNRSKRKACEDVGGSPEVSQVEKKLKLGEVEMKEAKSVLKHKMADMLNVLHPDTSNEAT